MRRHALWLMVALGGGACGGGDSPGRDTPDAGPPAFEEPVLTNPDMPIRYPPDLFAAGTEGTVVLRLFVDADGTVIPDSVRIAEGSGVAAFDSVALAAVPAMRFAPARREGRPTATAFLQPVHFRHPEASRPEGGS